MWKYRCTIHLVSGEYNGFEYYPGKSAFERDRFFIFKFYCVHENIIKCDRSWLHIGGIWKLAAGYFYWHLYCLYWSFYWCIWFSFSKNCDRKPCAVCLNSTFEGFRFFWFCFAECLNSWSNVWILSVTVSFVGNLFCNLFSWVTWPLFSQNCLRKWKKLQIKYVWPSASRGFSAWSIIWMSKWIGKRHYWTLGSNGVTSTLLSVTGKFPAHRQSSFLKMSHGKFSGQRCKLWYEGKTKSWDTGRKCPKLRQ